MSSFFPIKTSQSSFTIFNVCLLHSPFDHGAFMMINMGTNTKCLPQQQHPYLITITLLKGAIHLT